MANFTELTAILSEITWDERDLHFVHPDEMPSRIEALGRRGVRGIRIGLSRRGRDIFALEAGKGPRVIVAAAGSHADEPTGTVTLLVLAGELADLQQRGFMADCTFCFIPQLDPDGTDLNWRWMKGPYSYREYTLYRYRQNDPAQDVEHGIPLFEEQQMRPEVEAFKRYVDGLPSTEYFASLHTTHVLGGAVFLIEADECADFAPIMGFLRERASESGLAMDDADLHGLYGIRKLAPGFLTSSRHEDMSEYYRDNPEMGRKVKMSLIQYMKRCRGAKLALIAELPFLVDEEFNCNEETEFSLVDYWKEIIRHKEKTLSAMVSLWESLREYAVTGENAFWHDYYEFMLAREPGEIKALRGSLGRFEGKKAAMRHLYSLFLGRFHDQVMLSLMAMRRLQGLGDVKALKARAGFERDFEKAWNEYEKRMTYRVLPLAEQVKLQGAMILAGLLLE
ncbi:MAG: M14 family zinc carboxypeptidase [Candidatus Eremiobacteraeota bacterium]|nr:M14 family zinc carboxypeptidase [Candidatus Eremiobacteraeota bacterium]